MRRSWPVCSALTFLLACSSPAVRKETAATGDYWMYIGTDTTTFEPRDSQGIYVCKFHSANGKVEPVQLAARRVPQMLARVRAWSPRSASVLRGVQNPTFLAIHPNGRYLYTADTNHTGTVSGFQIDSHTGQLALLNVKPSGGSHTVFVALDHTGRNVLCANYDDKVAVLPIGPDGLLRDATSVVEHSGPDHSLQARSHSINPSPDNRFAVVTDTVLDEILVYRFDSDHGVLTPNDPPMLRTSRGMAPRQLSFHPNGIFAYAVGERGPSIVALRWDAQQGTFLTIETVRSVPADFTGRSSGTEAQVDAAGKFLYVSNRGHESIGVFAIDPSHGTLTPIQYQPTRGQMPRDFCIDPTGRYLFVANALSGSVVQFQIDQLSGRLVPTGYSFKVPAPQCIRFAPAS